MKICIVDDDLIFAQKAENTVKEYFSSCGEEVQVSKYGEGYSVLSAMEKGWNYDLYFVDVEMPQINGLELAQKIHEREQDARIVLLTSYEKYAFPSYKLKAYYYILKDEFKAEIPTVLERLATEKKTRDWGSGDKEDYYLIQNGILGKRVKLDDILYLTKEKKYVIFHCKDGLEYKERIALTEAYRKLPRTCFILVDKGSVINMRHVSGWNGFMIRLDDGADRIEVPVSRRMSREVKDALARFWRRK